MISHLAFYLLLKVNYMFYNAKDLCIVAFIKLSKFPEKGFERH